jgi:hypothetical protein
VVGFENVGLRYGFNGYTHSIPTITTIVLTTAVCDGLRSTPDCRTRRVDEDVAILNPSQSRTCRFPASGSSWKSFAREGVAMDDPGRRQRMPL